MSKHFARPRGLISARADGSADLTKMIEGLNSAFSAFKTENDARIKALETGRGDVLTDEKIGRINSDIAAMNTAITESKKLIAALQVGTDRDTDNPNALEHVSAFDKYFRKGVVTGLGELQVKAGLTTQVDPSGGYLVPTQTETAIDRVLGTASIMRNLATVMPIGTSEYRKFVNMGGASSGWVGEEESRSATTTPTLRELIFTVMEMYAFPFTTQQMLDDGIIDIAAWLADEVNITFAEQEGSAFIGGSGAKKPRGILAYSTVANASYAWGSIGYIATGAAAAFATSSPADALISLFYALKAGYRNAATWLTSDVVLGTIRQMKDGQGNYLWAPPTVDMPGTILQKPVETDDNMQALGANAYPVAFGDFKRGYLILDRLGVRVLRDDLTVKGKVGFYTTKRVGGGIANFEAIKLLKCATS